MLSLSFLFGDKHVDIEDVTDLIDDLSYVLKVTDQANSTDNYNCKFCVHFMPKYLATLSYFIIPSISTIKATETILSM